MFYYLIKILYEIRLIFRNERCLIDFKSICGIQILMVKQNTFFIIFIAYNLESL